MIKKIATILILLMLCKNLFGAETKDKKEVEIYLKNMDVAYYLCIHKIIVYHATIKENSEIDIETFNLYISNKEYRDVGTKYYTFYISAFIEYVYNEMHRADEGEQGYTCFISRKYDKVKGVRVIIFKGNEKVIFDFASEKTIKLIEAETKDFTAIKNNTK